MDFRIDCPCGEHVTVTEASAEATLKCNCGRPITVPSSPALRVAAGLPAEVLSPEQEIGRLVAAGRLPGTKACLRCGCETDQVLSVLTECERAYQQNASMPVWFTLVTLILVPFGHFFQSGGEEISWHGRDTILLLPIPACERCERALRRRKLLKRCLEQIPEYRRLLEKFPWARVTLRKPR